MKKKVLSFIITMVMLVTAVIPASAQSSMYPDVAGHWAQEQIEALTQAGIVHGYPDGTVRPDKTITQAEYAALLSYAAGLKTTDVSGSHKESWARPFESALETVGAFDETGYDADAPITRLEMVTWAITSMAGVELAENRQGATVFSDDEALTSEEKGYINLAVESGLLYGYPDGSVRPQETSTRAEAFSIIFRYNSANEYIQAQNKPTGHPPAVNNNEMVVSLGGPDQAETYTSVEIKVIHRNMSHLRWEIKGYNPDSPIDSASYESCLDDDGGTITFFTPGQYELQATAYDKNDKEGIYTLYIHVTDPDLRISAPKETEPYNPVVFTVFAREGITNLKWTVSRKDGDEVSPQDYIGNLTETVSEITFWRKGVYIFNLTGEDESGVEYKAEHTIDVYSRPYGTIYTSPTSFKGRDTYASISHFAPENNMTLEWQVLKDGEVQPWDEVIDRKLDFNGGTFQFLKTGSYTLRLLIKDSDGHEFNMDCHTDVYEPLEYAITLPESAYVGDIVEVGTQGLNGSHQGVEWSARLNDSAYEFETLVETVEPLDYSGGKVRFNQAGRMKLGLSVADESGYRFYVDQPIRIYPRVGVGLQMPDSAWVGADVWVQAVTDYNEDSLPLQWIVKKDGEVVSEEDVLIGDFSTGTVSFLVGGTYEITAFVTDGLGNTFSDSRNIVVTESAELPEPTFTVPELAYVGREVPVAFTEDFSSYTIQWTYSRDGMEGAETESITGRLGADGGNISFNGAGTYSLKATVSNDAGQEKSYTASVTVKNQPHIRMNPLDRNTYEEILDYVDILHVHTSKSAYPDFTYTDGMTITYNLLENGELAGEDAAYFYTRSDGYSVQPKREGDFIVRATADDGEGNVFTFTTQVKAVPVVSAEITGLPETVGLYEELNVCVTPHNITDETVEWKLSSISEEAAAPYMEHGLKNLWLMAKDWQEMNLTEVTEGSLSESGGQLHFTRPGIYCLRTSITDQYDKTTERTAVVQVSGS